MKKLLYVTANPKGLEKSKGLQIGETFINEVKKNDPLIEITRLDLFNNDLIEIPDMDANLVAARGKVGGYGVPIEELPEEEREKLLAMYQVADFFKGFDYYVFVSPVWNLGSPAVLKAFIDTLFVQGKTLAFTANGPKGLLEGKQGIHIQTRGGIYTQGPMKELESGDRYLQIAMNMLGVSMKDTVYAEGFDHFPAKIPEIVAEATERAILAARDFVKKEMPAELVTG